MCFYVKICIYLKVRALVISKNLIFRLLAHNNIDYLVKQRRYNNSVCFLPGSFAFPQENNQYSYNNLFFLWIDPNNYSYLRYNNSLNCINHLKHLHTHTLTYINTKFRDMAGYLFTSVCCGQLDVTPAFG